MNCLSHVGTLTGNMLRTSAFKKHEDSASHKQVISVSLLPHQCGDIAEIMSSKVREEKKGNQEMLLVILQAIRYLARQGLALRGHEESEENFYQLLLMQSEDIVHWLHKKHAKYISPDCQNEILRLMAHSVLRKIIASIHESMHYTIMADEVTDASNREQFVLCLRWVSKSFEVSED